MYITIFYMRNKRYVFFVWRNSEQSSTKMRYTNYHF